MNEVQAILFGSVLGLVGTVPPALLFERALKNGHPRVRHGLASVVASFALLSGAMLAVRMAWPERTLVFGVAEAASFLLVWAVEAIRAWRAQ